MNSPVSGVNYLFEGFSLITKPGLRRYVIIPLFINIFLFIGLFFLLFHYMDIFNAWFMGHLPYWLHWLAAILWVLFFLSFFLIFIYLFVTIANFISAPFNSLLAEKVEIYLTGVIPEQRSLFENIKDVPRIVGRQLAILGYYLPRAILLLILFFIPIVQAFAAILWFLFNAWFMTMTYIDYPTDNNRVSLRDVRLWLKENNWLSLGFGMSVLVATMIPVVNLFTIPAATAAATKLWVENRKRGQVDPVS